MAFKLIKNASEFIGTAAELAALTAGEKALIKDGSTFWAYDTKAKYIFAAGEFRAVV